MKYRYLIIYTVGQRFYTAVVESECIIDAYNGFKLDVTHEEVYSIQRLEIPSDIMM